MAAVPAEYAADISGLYNTNSQLAALVGVATFGTAYLGLITEAGQPTAMRAFASIAVAFAATALFAAFAANQAIGPSATAPAGRRGLFVAVRDPR